MNISGYPAPISNYTYTPNQFFDVVLPHYSRGAVRICTYMIRQALGWCDNEGKISLCYDLISKMAHISREAVGSSINELIEGRIIKCLREPVSSMPGCRGGVSGLYELCWSSSEPYTCNPEEFNGFFDDGNNGCMTRVPDLFLDYTVLYEKLSVVRVIGCILRNTIGFQAGRGMRRTQVQYSYRQIMEISGISSTSVLAAALSTARNNGHIIELPGFFDKNAGLESRATVYSIRWEDNWGGDIKHINSTTDSGGLLRLKTKIEVRKPKRAILKLEAGYADNRSGDWDRNLEVERVGNKNGDTIKIEAGNRLENRSDKEITPKITINKQQQSAAVESLIAFGFDSNTASEIAAAHPEEIILRQIEYFPKRTRASNPQGMLRRAIEGNWAPPASYLDAAESRKIQEEDEKKCRLEQHIGTYMSKFNEYIDTSLEDIRGRDPEAWYLFEESEVAFVERLRSKNPMYVAHPDMLENFLSHHNESDQIRDRAKTFFVGRLLSFWDWDRDINPKRYEDMKDTQNVIPPAL